MKRSISLVLCLAMLVSVFSCLGLTASAAGDPKDLFTVKAGDLKDNKITYTVYLKKDIRMSAAVIAVKFDPEVLSLESSDNDYAYMMEDSYGDEYCSINGIYTSDYLVIGGTPEEPVRSKDTFRVAYMNGETSDTDNKAYSSNRGFMQFTFKVINANRPKTTVEFSCNEFYSQSTPANNVENGSDISFASDTITTLGQVVITSVESKQDGVKLSWKKLTGADGYRVYKKIDGENVAIWETTDGDVTSYLDEDVNNNTSYTYSVRAFNEASFEDENGNKYPAKLSAYVSTRYTVAPSKLTLANDDGKVVVSWSKVEGATAYRVYRRTVDADGDVSTWKYFDKITATKYSDKTAKSGVTYQYAVRVYSDGGNSDLYSEKEIFFLGVPEFSAEATVKGVKLTWDKVAGAESYVIYRKVSDGSWKSIKTVSSSETSYTDTAASSGKTNYYKIVAVNDSYKSDYESHKVYYLKTPTVSVKNTTSGVYTSWKKISGASSYEVYRKAGSAKSWTKIATTKSTSYTDKNVKSGTTYKYTIKAVNSKGNSKYGSTAYETIRFLSAPKLENIKSTKSGVTVYWDDVKGASKYHIYRKTGSGAYELLETVSGGSTVKYLDKTAKKGKTYTYKVYAGYSSYQSSYKSTLTIKDKY